MRLFLASIFISLSLSATAGDSFVYFGEATNEQVEAPLYWEGQAGELAKQREEDARNKAMGRNVGPANGFGAISTITDNPRKTYVTGYTRKNGTRVAPYYRSSR